MCDRSDDFPELSDAQKARLASHRIRPPRYVSRPAQRHRDTGGHGGRAQPAFVLRHQQRNVDQRRARPARGRAVCCSAGTDSAQNPRRGAAGSATTRAGTRSWSPAMCGSPRLTPTTSSTKSSRSSAPCAITALPVATRAPQCGRRSATSPSEAEHASAITCECCGEPGSLHHNYLVKTLCARCAETLGYAPTPPGIAEEPGF
jgi:hypothetical protein